MTKSKFQVGDEVVVVETRPPHVPGIGWNDAMDIYLGKFCIITKVRDCSLGSQDSWGYEIRLLDGINEGWTWLTQWLKPAQDCSAAWAEELVLDL